MDGDVHFELIRELGTGTWGTVYQARGADGREVALKVLHPLWDPHDHALEALRADLAALAEVSAPEIARPHGLVQVASRWAVVSDFVPGPDLGAVAKALRQRSEAFPVRAALEATAAVARALAASPVLHRDLKPTAVVLTPEGQAVVVDFGMSREEFKAGEAATQSVRYGSVRYQSPERRRGDPDEAAGDVYALGALAAELLAGHPVANAETSWPRHVQLVLPVVAEVRARAGEDVARFVEDLLAFQPGSRPPAGEVASRAGALAATATGEGLVALANRNSDGRSLRSLEGAPPLQPRASPGEPRLRPSDGSVVAGPTQAPPIAAASAVPVPRAANPPPAQAQLRRWAALALALALALGAVGFALQAAESPETEATP